MVIVSIDTLYTRGFTFAKIRLLSFLQDDMSVSAATLLFALA